jgi:ribosomal protein S3
MREIYEKRQKVIKRDLEKKKRKQRSKKQKEFIKHLREKKSLTYRWFMEKKWKELLKNILEARIKHNFKEEAKIKINFLKSPWIKSSLFARYAVFILKRRKGKMGRIMENLLYRTKYYGGEKHNIYGIYITGAGRFTKRQRASFRKNQRGRTPFSTVSAPLEFSEMSVPLKYGACNVRVWVCHLQS